MKKVILLITVLIPMLLSSQEITKKKEIINLSNLCTINLYQDYLDGKLVGEHVLWMSKNNEYKQIIDLITIYSGDMKGLADLLDKSIEFCENEDVGSMTTIGDVTVNIGKITGWKYFSFYADNGFTYMKIKNLIKMRKAVEKYL
ncbi:MAG: hypothetical protein CVT99_06315 [Bacteroidetes bacterium HGW-Bacteroidetes-16]|jgi:hypothetical protein|nr:MAG: hypothetical protein CVT99_06315 [Bacteroidetes bacterium HGW-Bacteroidetes-16]